ncbi:MAG: MBOAT family protein [Lachnospiraceae bacterium]|nr:MAG: MBOAT family protein [Lachnospiraceae bacterium]
MAYNTNVYFIFLILVAVVYSITPKRYRYVTLLLGSLIFAYSFSRVFISWTLLAGGIAWLGGIFIDKIVSQEKGLKGDEKKKVKKRAKAAMLIPVISLLAILIGLKYTNFIVTEIMKAVGTNSLIISQRLKSLVVPIGISFYTLQAISYLLDIYWKREKAEKNPLKVLLFLMFFPTLMEGPIARWGDVKDSLFEGNPITLDTISDGSIRIVIGLFKRMIISDRLNVVVNRLYAPNLQLDGVMILLTAVVTTVQLYMEFAGTIDIVIGSAKIFGITLPENFRQPFFAKSAAEFWRRWHITLGTWFKNYIFYPVSTSGLMKKWGRFGRKHCGKYLTNVVTSAIALLPVWILNGLWHGPKWPYIIYGIYYFIILLLEVVLKPAGERIHRGLHLSEDGKPLGIIRMVRTWIIIIFGEMLFRANTFGQFLHMMASLFIFPGNSINYTLNTKVLGLDIGDVIVAIAGSIIVFIVDYKLEKDPMYLSRIHELSRVKRWGLYYVMIFSIVIFGAYGVGYTPADLIYAGF